MGKQDIVDEIENRLAEEETLSGDDLDPDPECHHCGEPMPYDIYNEHSPQTDYICHVLPGEDTHTPTGKLLYCDVSCLMSELRGLAGS